VFSPGFGGWAGAGEAFFFFFFIFFPPSIRYIRDRVPNPLAPQGSSEFWQTPKQSLHRGMGDCDDIAIAKFFTLRAMGVPEKNLRLFFGIILPKEYHLNVGYFPCPEVRKKK
jgi:hypothetical protein